MSDPLPVPVPVPDLNLPKASGLITISLGKSSPIRSIVAVPFEGSTNTNTPPGFRMRKIYDTYTSIIHV